MRISLHLLTVKLIATKLSKTFGREIILKDFSYEFHSGNSYALLGSNGSGKSTLLQMLSGFLTPTKGSLQFVLNEKTVSESECFQHVSICAPYLELIEELTLREFLEFHFCFKSKRLSIEEMIDYMGLRNACNKLLSQFSSGMKQRVKLAQAFFSDSLVLLLDEPCTNLDEEGIRLYEQWLKEYGGNRIVIVASNDEQEYRYTKHRIVMSDYKPVNTWN